MQMQLLVCNVKVKNAQPARIEITLNHNCISWIFIPRHWEFSMALEIFFGFFAKYVDKNLGLFEPILEILVWVGSLEFFDQDF